MAAPTRADLAALDAADPLARFRDQFVLPAGVIYLDGNSLGALPKAAPARLDQVAEEEWGSQLIRSWNSRGWIEAPRRVGDKIARLIGAGPGEVVACDSTSVNLFKALAGAVSLRPGRRVILTEAGNFPTDLYMMQGLAALLGGGVEVRAVAREALRGALDEDVICVALTHVHYKSAERWPMAEITALAHAKGALAIWDLSHSAGAMAVDLNGAGADLAVGCGYKHLNGGPGAPAFIFVAERHQAAIRSPLTGWMGHAAPFDFVDDYAPAPGIDRQLCGTPAILSLAALEVGIDLMLQADMAALEAKAAALGDAFIALVEDRCAGLGLTLASSREGARRGAHVVFAHAEAYAVMQALIDRGVIGDFRAPDILRFGLTPLYLRFVDVFDAVEILRDILATGAHLDPRFSARNAVT
jgi:kynureninase